MAAVDKAGFRLSEKNKHTKVRWFFISFHFISHENVQPRFTTSRLRTHTQNTAERSCRTKRYRSFRNCALNRY